MFDIFRSWPLGLAHATALPALLCSNMALPLLQSRLRRDRTGEGA